MGNTDSHAATHTAIDAHEYAIRSMQRCARGWIARRRLLAERRRKCTVHLSKRILASDEDTALLRATAAVGWNPSLRRLDSLSSSTVAFHYATPQNIGSVELNFDVEKPIFSRFPGMPDCCRKAIFAHLLCRMRRLLPQSLAIHDRSLLPRQWALPQQRPELEAHVQAASSRMRARPWSKNI
jgi:hypothetical protein